MTKISKALDKYKKEHNLSSNQIFNLEDVQKTKENRVPEPATWTSDQEAPLTVISDKLRKPHRKKQHAPKEEKDAAPGVSKIAAQEAAKATGQEPAIPREPTYASPQPNRFSQDLISILSPNCAESEIFKVLRAKILFPKAGTPPKSILVTSAAPAEGKSFIAANLAVYLAHNIENSVLLVDCDIRRPTIHKLFGLGLSEGLSEHLSNGNKLSALLIKPGINKLTILPSGRPPANPSELLSSDKMAALLEELKSRYDDRFLIIDSPPPMLAPETKALAKNVDGIILVIRSGKTPLHQVESLIEDLGREKILGAVINHYNSPVSAKYYGYGKYQKYYRSESQAP